MRHALAAADRLDADDALAVGRRVSNRSTRALVAQLDIGDAQAPRRGRSSRRPSCRCPASGKASHGVGAALQPTLRCRRRAAAKTDAGRRASCRSRTARDGGLVGHRRNAERAAECARLGRVLAEPAAHLIEPLGARVPGLRVPRRRTASRALRPRDKRWARNPARGSGSAPRHRASCCRRHNSNCRG